MITKVSLIAGFGELERACACGQSNKHSPHFTPGKLCFFFEYINIQHHDASYITYIIWFLIRENTSDVFIEFLTNLYVRLNKLTH